MHQVITIGRQCGSGGREIGRLLAQALDVPFYDKEALREYAAEHGVGRALLESYGDKHASSLLLSLSTSAFSFGYYDAARDSTIGQKAYLTAFETIREIAAAGPCVIVGRCADYVLRHDPAGLHFFLYAPEQTRVAAVAERTGADWAEAAQTVAEQDDLRRNYYNYYTRKQWGRVESYHASLDTSLLGLSGTAGLLRKIVWTAGGESAVPYDVSRANTAR